jgi:signal peptidase
LLTKGDNNAADDTELYARGQDYLTRKDIVGYVLQSFPLSTTADTFKNRSVVAYMPFVGYVTIMLSEHPWLKTVMLGIMGLVVVLQRE